MRGSSDPYAHLADRFLGHYGTLRGAVRHALVADQLDRHLPPPSLEVLDVGGGAGHQAMRLARVGYDVTLLDALVAVASPGALLSLLFKNADALPLRAALEERWKVTLAAFDADHDRGGLGVETRADRPADIIALLGERGATVEGWYGIRIFSDHLHDWPVEDLIRFLPLEEAASGRDPYRVLGRLVHVVARCSRGS